MRLLLIEDDEDLGPQLQRRLQRDGFAVDLATDGVQGCYLGQEEAYDIVVLDLGLPDRPGLELLKQWRLAEMSLPVIILTARDAWQEKVDGLKAGADDYLTKPFVYEELLARVQALIRRSKGRTKPQLASHSFFLNEETQTLGFDHHQEPLTGTEFRLLRYLLLHPGVILSKTQLTEHIYAYDADKDSNVIEVYIRRLRDKVGKHRIVTKRGQGYVYQDSQSPTHPNDS